MNCIAKLYVVDSSRGHTLSGNGTDCHLVLLDVRPFGLTGGKVEKVARLAKGSRREAQIQVDSARGAGMERVSGRVLSMAWLFWFHGALLFHCHGALLFH